MADDTNTPTSPDSEPQPHTTRRGANGRFEPGASGNPKARRRGALNHATLLKAACTSDDDPLHAARAIIRAAASGNLSAAKFVVDRLAPRWRPASVRLALPADVGPDDLPAVGRAILAAMLAGELAPREARDVLQMVARCRRMIAAAERDRAVRERPPTRPPATAPRAAADSRPGARRPPAMCPVRGKLH